MMFSTLVLALTVATVLGGGDNSRRCAQGLCETRCGCNNASRRRLGGHSDSEEDEAMDRDRLLRDTPIELDNGDVFDADYACMFAMDVAREENQSLRRIMSQDWSTKGQMMADVVTTHLQVIQRRCFIEAKKAISSLGQMREKYPEVKLNSMPDKDKITNEAHTYYKMILDMKQCIAYSELASRYTRNSIVWAWVMSSSTRAEQDMACGKLVNTVNAGLRADAVKDAQLLKIEDFDDVIQVEALKMSSRLARAERQAGISTLMAEVLGLAAPLAGSMMAQMCLLWDGKSTF